MLLKDLPFLCAWGPTKGTLTKLPVFLPGGQDNFGYDLAAVEAAKKKHEAIETDTAAYEERVRALEDLAQELEQENYHDQKRITARKDNILRLWDYLQELLRARRQRLEKTLDLQKLFQDMLHSIDWMDGIKVGLGTPAPPPGTSAGCASVGASQPHGQVRAEHLRQQSV